MTEPMLASPSSKIAPTPDEALGALTRTGQWAFELKLDGIRCIARVQAGVVTLTSRALNDMTYRYPEIVQQLAGQFADLDVTLDGEIIVCGEDGRPDFAAVHRRDAQGSAATAARAAKATPATFVVFDWLEHADQPYTWRRQQMDTVLAPRLVGPHLSLNASHEEGEAMWRFALEHQLEGLMAKRRSSRYRGGRSTDWVKLKPRRRISALVSEVIKGDGRRADSFGALALSLIGPDSRLVAIGRVGSGFSQSDLVAISRAVTQGPLIVDVEFMELSPAGQLRHPVYMGIRRDVSILDCTVDQLQ